MYLYLATIIIFSIVHRTVFSNKNMRERFLYDVKLKSIHSYWSEYSEYLFCRNAQSDEVHVVRDNEQEVLWRRLECAHDSREHAVAVAEEARAGLVRERAPESEEGGHKERGVRKPRNLFVKSRCLRTPLILHSIRNYVHMSLHMYVHTFVHIHLSLTCVQSMCCVCVYTHTYMGKCTTYRTYGYICPVSCEHRHDRG